MTPSNRGLIIRAVLRILVVIGVLLAVYVSVPIGERPVGMVAVRLLLGLVVVAAVLGWQIRSIMKSPYPTTRAVEAVGLSLPLLVLIFAAAYVAVDHMNPDSFSEELSRLDAVYFAVTVLTTVGFGDISPRGDVARVLVTLQMVVDIVIIGVVARVLVEAVRRRRADLDRGPSS